MTSPKPLLAEISNINILHISQYFFVKRYKRNQWNIPNILGYIWGIFNDFFKGGFCPFNWPWKQTRGHNCNNITTVPAVYVRHFKLFIWLWRMCIHLAVFRRMTGTYVPFLSVMSASRSGSTVSTSRATSGNWWSDSSWSNCCAYLLCPTQPTVQSCTHRHTNTVTQIRHMQIRKNEWQATIYVQKTHCQEP